MVTDNRINLILTHVWAILVVLIIGCSSPVNPNEEKTDLSDLSADGSGSAQTSTTAQSADSYSINLYNNNRRFDNDILEISSLKGRPIIINFWAAMCPPCRAEMPELQNFYNLYQGKVTIVGIDVGKQTGLGTTEEAIKLMETLNIDYLTGSLNDPDSLKTFNVSTMPTTIFMDSNGDVFRRWTGAITFETLSVITNLMLSYQDT